MCPSGRALGSNSAEPQAWQDDCVTALEMIGELGQGVVLASSVTALYAQGIKNLAGPWASRRVTECCNWDTCSILGLKNEETEAQGRSGPVSCKMCIADGCGFPTAKI